MTELHESAPPPPGFGMRAGRVGHDAGYLHRPAPLIVRGTTLSHLTKTVEAEIIPRLVMAHRDPPRVVMPPAVVGIEDEIAIIVELMLGSESHRAAERVQACRDRGMSLETVYVTLLVPAARQLRHLWMNDEWDFAEVTLALWRMQQLLRELSPAFCADAVLKSVGLRSLLTPAPGEEHDIGHMMFGLVLAGEFFRRDGWDTWIEPDPSRAAFVETIRHQWFDVVEFFAGNDKKLDELASIIRTVRRESANKDIGVMVCGPAFTERPELVLSVGADAVVSDFSQETLQAQHVVDLLAGRR